ncbi:pilus assembly protein [Luteimonas kalidii]|uniref:PilC/PilY family type IV pilus protein n=1 Tax=Luteimonas kalidii TaxID=3042025 RepID=A0ABT6JXX0_9GAMM|nr:PilC/PilY family type IV pilus protein [Luteimonas kalidii]MDH5835549.1 PilC/PilY family type IV pilus protein [Luteimonas kalidii]
MKTRSINSRRRSVRGSGRSWWAAPFALLSTLLALPASAGIAIPDQPLIIGSRIPPNILFLLDNSGSMADTFLPDGIPTGWARQAYTRNRIYYNPNVVYQPWVDSTGAVMTGGQDYRNAYSHIVLVPPFNNGTTDLRDSEQTFYVPKNSAGDLTDLANYWRYQIHEDEVIVRSEWTTRSGGWPSYNQGLSNRNCSTGGGTNWRNCTEALPTTRTAAQERRNFATWYSYHRSRSKVAKAAVGRAFAEIGGEYRVGYRNIWNDMRTSGSSGGVNWGSHPISQSKPIPVAWNKGLFEDPNGPGGADNNKTAWYQRLYAEDAADSTPLREALYNAGKYFEDDSSSTGPWGEGIGGAAVDHFACRQNYTILTTDGYRNDSDGWSKVGEEDNSEGEVITSPFGDSYQYVPTAPYASEHSSNLADIAMRFWKRDLRPDLDNVVAKTPANPAFWQHMVTFGISLGAAGTLDPESDLPALTAGTKSWPYHTNLNPRSIDDFWHASVNGRGKFVVASDADEFSQALRGALSEIATRDSSFSNVASNSVSLDTGSQVFNASYVTGTWTGTLAAREVTASGVEADPDWTASLPDWDDRKIFTSTGTAGAQFPTTAQRALLGRTGGSLNFPVTAADNADYIKGDESNEASEGGLLRNRSTKLGDIIGSSPAYVKDTNTLYVGANDGMLHAFDASNGRELFAYVPNIINFGHLSTLSRGDYSHKFFVDGPVVVSSRSLTPAKNILIGSLGRGGKGLFALDVTAPGTVNAAGLFKWERSNTPGGHMGLVLNKPLLSRVGTGVVAAVFGNGINSTNDRAALMVLNAETGAVIAEIDTGAGSAAAPNGLSAVTGIVGADGRTLAYAYAGDMLGNVWKFDLTDASPAAWTATRLFTATNDDGAAQPISGAITIASHPIRSQRWLFFGTGRYLTADDISTSGADVQSMYGFIDEGAAIERSDLTERTIAVTDESLNGYPVRAFEERSGLPVDSKGWYIDLPESGERIIQDAQVVSTFLVTASMIPSGNACNPDGGGYINALDAFTGTSAGASYFDLGGEAGTDDSVIGDDDLPVGSVDVRTGMPTLPNLLRGLIVVGGTGSGNLRGLRTLTPRWDRASWREIRGE